MRRCLPFQFASPRIGKRDNLLQIFYASALYDQFMKGTEKHMKLLFNALTLLALLSTHLSQAAGWVTFEGVHAKCQQTELQADESLQKLNNCVKELSSFSMPKLDCSPILQSFEKDLSNFKACLKNAYSSQSNTK